MATGKTLEGKQYAGNPHVRFDDGVLVSTAMPKRVSLFCGNKQSVSSVMRRIFFGSPIFLASMIVLACQIARSGEVCTDCIWVPHAVSMTITGEAKSDTEEPFLVAGSNATAKIVRPLRRFRSFRS